MKKAILFIVMLIALNYQYAFSADIIVNENLWTLTLNGDTRKIEVKYENRVIFSGVYAEVQYSLIGQEVISTGISYNYPSATLSQTAITDGIGTGRKYTFSYSGNNNSTLQQHFYFYDNVPYFLVETSLKDNRGDVSSNYLVPFVTEEISSFLPDNATNRMLWVPWDNDAWVRYQSYELNRSMTSHEVSAIFSGTTRYGVVAGAVEHDTWKNGITVNASENNRINRFACISGYVSETTRDVLPHGKISGAEVRSARFMLGCFSDWRKGMDTYGDANSRIVPGPKWKEGTPFGWSSWGCMQDKITYNGITDVSAFLKDSLAGLGFKSAQGKAVLSLDAFWNDNISTFSMKQFATACKNKDQIAGIYYGPFCDWTGDPNRIVEGSGGLYKYKDIWLKVNGAEHRQGGICIDPTHPGTKMAMEYNLNRYKSWGYEYIKVDFLTNGAIEADSYYNPAVTTGTQAYNEGMQHMFNLIGQDMYIVLAISPIFPYQYAHGRRTCCDSYSRIDETEYVMNSTSFGWWTNQIYQVNDPDHLVMLSQGTESYGTNRARVTSGAITGAFLFGDNFSPLVDKCYPARSRDRAMLFMTNNDINDIVRTCGTFMPVDGYKAKENGAENLLMYHTDEYVYMASINYNSQIVSVSGNMSFERLGINPQDVESIKELWTGSKVDIKDQVGFNYAVPAADARVYRITKKNTSSNILPVAKNTSSVKISRFDDLLVLNAYEQMERVTLYNINGVLIKTIDIHLTYDVEIDVGTLFPGIYLLKVDYSNRMSENLKITITR